MGIFQQSGESREKVVGWMKTPLKDIPENEQNFVLMDSTHTLSLKTWLSTPKGIILISILKNRFV